MKRLFLYLLLPAVLLMSSCMDDVVTRDMAQLPEPARQFVQKTFRSIIFLTLRLTESCSQQNTRWCLPMVMNWNLIPTENGKKWNAREPRYRLS